MTGKAADRFAIRSSSLASSSTDSAHSGNKALATAVRALMLMALLMSPWQSQTSARQNLPSMGEPADASLSPATERELGRRFMRQVRASVPMVRDVQVTEYIESLGARLAVNIDNPENHDFNFFIIQNPAINAFAIPGGYIGLNSGLIDAMNEEDQLAAVIGHEIAHITQRHHARAVASSSRSRMTTAFAVLAAIIIGQSNPQAGQAALAAGLAATQQSIINFTRSNEYEADRIGIAILADASYQPAAMAEAFEILRRKNSLNTSNNQIEYLRTHPLDNNRIAEAKNRAASLSDKKTLDTRIDFAVFKARARVLTANEKNRLERYFRARTESADKARRIGAQYALAMIDIGNRRYSNASKRLDRLLKLAPDNLHIQLLTAEAWYNAGDADKSATRLELLASIFPDNYSVVSMQVEQLLQSSRHGNARKKLRRYLRANSAPHPLSWRDLANVEEKLGNPSASHEALARYFSELNELGRARQQLNLALRVVSQGSSDELRLKARLRALDIELERRNR